MGTLFASGGTELTGCSTPLPPLRSSTNPGHPHPLVSYDTIYPIYFDAKAPHCAGGRRVPKTLALEWPLAESIAGACGKLGVQTVFEVSITFQAP